MTKNQKPLATCHGATVMGCGLLMITACSTGEDPVGGVAGGDASPDGSTSAAPGGSSTFDAATTQADSSPSTTPGVDSGGTAPAVDAGKKPPSGQADTGTTPTPGTCPTPLPGAYACPAAQAKLPTATTCTAADVQAYFDACWATAATQTTCTAFMASNTGCDSCIKSWTRADGRPNTGACYLAIDAIANDCAKADGCDNDCSNVTCYNDCPQGDKTSLDACLSAVTAQGGACYTVANETKLATCRADAKFKACQVSLDADIQNFYKSACHTGSFTATAPTVAATGTRIGEASFVVRAGAVSYPRLLPEP